MSDSYLSQKIIDILSIARLAPSVHNTQPWKAEVKDDDLIIYLNESRRLKMGDPTGRQAFISLGIFVEACIIGLAANGLKASGVSLNGSSVIIKTAKGSIGPEEEAKALERRYTDRSVYRKVELSEHQKAAIANSWQSSAVEIIINDRADVIKAVAGFTEQALLLALSRPDFRKELAAHLVGSSKKTYGIPVSTLGTRPIRTALTRQLVSSGLSRKSDAALEQRRWLSASGLVFILAVGDEPKYWLESGRAYMRASLAITQLGLSQATSAAIVEAADFHEDIEKMLVTDKRIQCLLRIGQGQSKHRRSGRLSPQQILIT